MVISGLPHFLSIALCPWLLAMDIVGALANNMYFVAVQEALYNERTTTCNCVFLPLIGVYKEPPLPSLVHETN